MKKKKEQHVGCAIIRRGHELLIAQRLPGSFLGGFWEFPGGKCEAGETMEACLVREVREELAVRIQPRLFLGRTDHCYAHKNVSLYFYICDWLWGQPVAHECRDFKWVRPEELKRYRFPPADTEVINRLLQRKLTYFGRG